MAKSGQSRAEANRAIRRQALREQLEAQGHVQHVVDILGKLSNLDETLDSLEIQRLSKVLDTKLKLIGKFLPDDKEPSNINLGGQDDNPLIQVVERKIVRSDNTDC